MDYGYRKHLDMDMGGARAAVTDALKVEGFGVLTEIDIAAAFKEKRGIDFRPYLILGACNPDLAHRALQADDQLGLLLPCNVVLQAGADGGTDLSMMRPSLMADIVGDGVLDDVAQEADTRIKRALDAVG
jgi:uncharacterized protein (DUF302 family)